MFISCGYFTKKCLLFLVVPVAIIIRLMLANFKGENNVFYQGFVQFFGKSINGILWLVVERSITSKKIEKLDDRDTMLVINDQNNSAQDNDDILNENENEPNRIRFESQHELNCKKIKKMENKRNCKKICFLIVICILDFFSVVCDTVTVKIKSYSEYSCGLIFLILAARLFEVAIFASFMIKNNKMYSHHYLSIIILIMVVIAINIFSIFKEENNNKNYFLKLGLMLIPEVLFSITYVCYAKYLNITEGNVYKLLFINGIIGIILLILLQIVVYFFLPCNLVNKFFYEANCDNMNKNLSGMIKSFGFGNFLDIISVLLILINFCEICSKWLLVFNFSLNHLSAICSIPLIFYCLTRDGFKIENFILYILGIFIVFMTFIYNEIIILRFCGFDENTAIEIHNRALEDLDSISETDVDKIIPKSNDNINQKKNEKTSDENCQN